MMNKLIKISYMAMAFAFVLSISTASADEYPGPAQLEPQLSSDGNTLSNATPVVAVWADPNPSPEQVSMPARMEMLASPETATANFSINYIPDGGTDLWGASCAAFPDSAKAAFNAAAAIWGNFLQSSVPISINACWSNLGAVSTLGYSGGGPLHRDFTGAPLPNTWYSGALANALHGSDLSPTSFDMHITYNSNFAWYYGTDGQTPPGQYDLMSVVLHEIAHGLNFTGSMKKSVGIGSWGDGTGYPVIYDRFMRDGTANPGNPLIDTDIYANPSTALGSALTSENIWFHGANAMAANGGQRVKIYAPSTWRLGSSYSHLDYTTFAGGENRLMVYAISSGVSTHDPGPVTLGIFKDMGWASVSAKSDFNGDGKTDILLRNTATGANAVWYMNGAERTGTASLPATSMLTWTIGGVGDFNSDGKPDILWRRTDTGKNAVWFMDGTICTGTASLPANSMMAWTIGGVGDFNSDGKPDILWRNTATGENMVWFMDGVASTGTAFLPTTSILAWTIGGVGDLNGDGKPDILWRRTDTGKNAVWFMDGTTCTATASLPAEPDPNWKIVNH